MTRWLLAACAYFALVFSAGFALGVLRVLLLVPLLGERRAELLELPVMVGLSWLAARFVLRRARLASALHVWLVGGLALALMLLFEFTLVLALLGQSIEAYLAGRDPLAFGAYVLALLVFAALPGLLHRRTA